ncbi:hypothetical protein [Aeromicrobium sp. 179-A 4D2 NHS]|uniref:hypothetical protein n=1 Tax=Aeromicrobium sp. 179-A 4D2 NHS TaxID=3142375 RepID=UPI0039A2B97F
MQPRKGQVGQATNNKAHFAAVTKGEAADKPLDEHQPAHPDGLKTASVDDSFMDDHGKGTEVTTYTADEAIAVAIRRAFSPYIDDDAPVEIIEENTHSGTDWTPEWDGSVTFKCDGFTETFETGSGRGIFTPMVAAFNWLNRPNREYPSDTCKQILADPNASRDITIHFWEDSPKKVRLLNANHVRILWREENGQERRVDLSRVMCITRD